jgi:hypothetical protein
MDDEDLCLRDRFGKAIQDHYPDGLSEEDGIEVLETLADMAGEGLASGTRDQMQSFVTLVMAEWRAHKRNRKRKSIQAPSSKRLQ